MPRRLFYLGILSACLGLLQGATLERLSLNDLIVKSSAIVRGRVSRSWGAFTGRHIFTHYEVQVSERWKGPDTATVELVVPGGQAGGLREVTPGAPALTEGQDYVLFLWTGKSGATQIIGFTQGVFTLPTDPATGQSIAVRAPSGNTVLTNGRISNDTGISMPLAALSARIASVLGSGK